MSTFEIHKNSITNLKTDAIVNAANSGLIEGGGVCGAIFKAAGSAKLAKECAKIGHVILFHILFICIIKRITKNNSYQTERQELLIAIL